MNGEERRKKIASRIGSEPVPAARLAEEFGVSRQVIVQDVALLRAEGLEIVATNRGYVLPETRISRVFKVRHTDEQVREELYLIADMGGCVEDVYVWHKVYGKIAARMGIDSRRKADEFVQKLESGVSVPLKNITGGYHYHTVSADSEQTLDAIEQKLTERGFFVSRES